MDQLIAYLPMDRRWTLQAGKTLPDRVSGAVLFADISGFTPLTEQLVRDLGPQRGAEELTIYLNDVYDALINELHRFGGSVISFAGDAITCWLEGDSGLRATACAVAMQRVMSRFANIKTPSGRTITMAITTAVAAGSVRRFLVGDPDIQVIDTLAGSTLDDLSLGADLAQTGEIVICPTTITNVTDTVLVREYYTDRDTQRQFAVVESVDLPITNIQWGKRPPADIDPELIRPWLLPPVYERLQSGQGEFLAELRPAVALFLRFSGIDYDNDEDAGKKLDSFVRIVQHTLIKYQSYLFQLTIGDKGSYLYAGFGAPFAHEDDPGRAISAALELRTKLQSLDFIETIQIGISQGRMRTGALGGTMRRTYSAMGDEVNLAARLMQKAEFGQILASERIFDATFNEFRWEKLPSVKVKGKQAQIIPFELVRARERQPIRLQEPNYATPLVGRKQELSQIVTKIAEAKEGKGQIVAITGEAGMGKSRLVAEAIRIADDAGFAGYAGECQSYGTGISYLVWHRIWRAFFNLDQEMSQEALLVHLHTEIAALDAKLAPRLPLLGAPLNLTLPDNELTQNFDAKLRKSSLESLLVAMVQARAPQCPLLFILDDCHWMDPLSFDLLDVISKAIAEHPVLIILAARTVQLAEYEFEKLTSLPYWAEINLSEFQMSEAEQLINLKLERFLAAPTAANKGFVAQVMQRADGNPFYIEELLNYLNDKGIDPNDDVALSQLDLPTSLHSLILSRIDQLTENQKSTLKVASVIGRLFKAAMLWGFYPSLGGEQRVKPTLNELTQLDLTSQDISEPELTYLFKNVVTQEVAYESLPFATRMTLHGAIGCYIEAYYEESLDQYVDLLAHHFERSTFEEKKRKYLLMAAQAAQADFANSVAIDYYKRVLPLLPAAEKGQVLLSLGTVFELVGRWDDAKTTYRQAIALAEKLDDHSSLAWSQTAMAELLRKQGAYDETLDWVERAQAIFKELNEDPGMAHTIAIAGIVSAQQGNYATARLLWEESLQIQRRLGNRPRVASLLLNLGVLARYQGDDTLARSLYEEALLIRRELGNKGAIAYSLNNLGNLVLDQGDIELARTYLEEAVALQQEVGDRWAIANAQNNLGNVLRMQGDHQTAVSHYKDSLKINRELGDKWALAYLLEDIGGLASLRGEGEEALRLIGAAAVLREEIGSPHSASDQAKLEKLLQPLRESMSQQQQAELLAAGREMPLEQAVQFAFNLWPHDE